ncbi:unnamed protein product [Brassica napus]|uniref:(rape) hypothetical protein n=1 Tax=Brassica napus TaxID=3708 RepID=A0A817AUT2_BRANA|nr:unnamed protein product [Brassica napus]
MSVAVCSSPVFSPSSSLFCNNKALNISPAHQNLTLSHSHLTPLASSPSAASPASSTPSTPLTSSPKPVEECIMACALRGIVALEGWRWRWIRRVR